MSDDGEREFIRAMRTVFERAKSELIRPHYYPAACSVCRVVGFAAVGGDYADRMPADGWPKFPHKPGCAAPSNIPDLPPDLALAALEDRCAAQYTATHPRSRDLERWLDHHFPPERQDQ